MDAKDIISITSLNQNILAAMKVASNGMKNIVFLSLNLQSNQICEAIPLAYFAYGVVLIIFVYIPIIF